MTFRHIHYEWFILLCDLPFNLVEKVLILGSFKKIIEIPEIAFRTDRSRKYTASVINYA